MEQKEREASALQKRRKSNQARRASDFMRQRGKIDIETANRVRLCLQAACIHESPMKMFQRYDKNKSGDLDFGELTSLIRRKLKVPPTVLSNRDIFALVRLLDVDRSGTLALDELADFVEYGLESEKRTQKWGDRPEGSYDPTNPETALPLERRSSMDSQEDDDASSMGRKKRRSLSSTFHRDALLRLRQRLRAAIPKNEDVLEWLQKYDVNGDGEMSAYEVRMLIRRRLEIPESELPTSDIAAFISALDLDDDKRLSVEELVDFIERGLTAFGVTLAGLGKAMKLDPAGTTSESLGRLLGACRARLGRRSVREAFKVGGGVSRSFFVDAVRKNVLGLDGVLAEEDLALLEKLFVRSGDVVDLREFAAFIKRGADVFNDVDKPVLETVTKETQQDIERHDLERKIANVEHQRSIAADNDRKSRPPPPGDPMRPRPSDALFSWLDDEDDTVAKQALLQQRWALRLHEDCGEPVAVATTLVSMGRRLHSTRLNALEPKRHLECAGDALCRAEHLLKGTLSLGVLDLLREAAEAYLEAGALDKAKRALTKLDGPTSGLSPARLRLAVQTKILTAQVAARRGDRRFFDLFTKAMKLIDKHSLGDDLLALAKSELAFEALDYVSKDDDDDDEERAERRALALENLREAASLNPPTPRLQLIRRRIAALSI